MIAVGTWPADAVFPIDSLVSDSVIIGDTAARGLAQLIEDLASGAVREELALAEAARQVANDFRIGTRVGRRINRFIDVNNPALHVTSDSLFLLLQASG